jgi:mannose-6-phosphate isomerase
MDSGPFRLNPSFREKVWGVADLSPWFPSPSGKIGEIWFLRPDQGPQPILVKFIFTSARLSVQVHPDNAYALARDGVPGKSEMWYILRAEPGAQLALGLREPVTRDALREAAEAGQVEQLLQWFPVNPGQVIFIPPGTVHAIGPGITLCEIQQNSDITYRLYDYGRGRELHVDKALDVATRGPHPGPSEPAGGLLGECEQFIIERFDLDRATVYAPDRERFHLLVFLEGGGTIAGQPFRAGEVWHVPGGAEEFSLNPDAPVRFLRSSPPLR